VIFTGAKNAALVISGVGVRKLTPTYGTKILIAVPATYLAIIEMIFFEIAI
jgi:hypothetical protein